VALQLVPQLREPPFSLLWSHRLQGPHHCVGGRGADVGACRGLNQGAGGGVDQNFVGLAQKLGSSIGIVPSGDATDPDLLAAKGGIT